jgi:hypothetical protein
MNLLYATVDILNFENSRLCIIESPRNVIKPEMTKRVQTKRVNKKEAILNKR